MKDAAFPRLLNRRNLSLAAVALTLAACDAFNSESDDTVDRQDVLSTRTFDETIQTIAQEVLVVTNVNGDIVVEASGSARRIRVEAQLIAGSDSRTDAERWLDKLAVGTEKRSDAVVVESEFPSDAKGRRLEIRYHIWVPQGLAVSLSNMNGRITLDGLVGDLDVNHINGRVEINDHRGSLDVHLVNGTIDCHVTLDPSGFAFLSTMNGEIQLDIPKSTSARIHAGTTNGEVRFENLTMHGVSGNARDRMGTMGDGAGQIELNAVNGTITVRGM